MTKQEILTKILTNQITTEKTNGITDFTEIMNKLNILVDGGSITSEQYSKLKDLVG
jgi:hypothetical protein